MARGTKWQYKIRQLTFHRQIRQILLSPINHLVWYMYMYMTIT